MPTENSLKDTTLRRATRRVRSGLSRVLRRPALESASAFEFIHYELNDSILQIEYILADQNTGLESLSFVGRGDETVVKVECSGEPQEKLSIDVTLLFAGFEDSVIDLYADVIGDIRIVSSGREMVRFGRALRTTRTETETATVEGEVWKIGRTVFNNVSLRKDGNHSVKLRSRLLSRTIHRDHERFKFEVTSPNIPLDHAELQVIGRSSQSLRSNPIGLTYQQRDSQKTGQWVYSVDFNLETNQLLESVSDQEETIDVSYVFSSNGNEIFRRGIYPRAKKYGRLRHLKVKDKERSTRLIAYQTFRSRRLAYRIEHIDPTVETHLRWASILSIPLSPVRWLSQIWLVGETPYKAQDNGYHFFNYASNRRPRTYYVIREDSSDAAKFTSSDSIVYWGSVKHIWLSVLASRLAGSHHSEYLLASRLPSFIKSCRGTRIFMQHGVTAMKNVTPNYGRLQSEERPTDKFLVVSDLERRIVVEDYGFRPNQVVVTGFARFDALFSELETEPIILVMPTWRDGLTREDVFLESDYYHAWSNFLTSSSHLSDAKKMGYEVVFLIHPNMRAFSRHFDFTNVTTLDLASTDVQRELKRSSILVTDYSSVAWDFAFLNKPVIYYHFDIKALTDARKPHIDFELHLPGPRATTSEQLWHEILAAVGRSGEVGPMYAERTKRFIEYRDQKNCQRIYSLMRRPGSCGVIVERWVASRFVQSLWNRFRRSRVYFFSMVKFSRFASLLPGKRSIIFEADRGTHFSDSPRAIYEEVVRRAVQRKLFWVDNTTRRYTADNVYKIRRNSPKYFWTLGRSQFWITNQNLRTGIKPRRDQTYLQTWHGTPIKRMQFDVDQMHGRAANYKRVAERQTGAWTCLLSPSPYATQAFRSAFRYSGEILELGYPRNDPLVDSDRVDESRSYVRRILGIADDDSRPIVLYAPTFRDHLRVGRHWTHNLELNFESLRSSFAEEIILVLRMHPLVRIPKASFEMDNFCIDASNYGDVQELLAAADVLITDYSSLFFDYALLNRPIIFYAYDLNYYSEELRGFYLNYRSSVPGPIVETQDGLETALRSALDGDFYSAPGMLGFSEKFNPEDDGKASSRVVNAILPNG